MEWNIEREGGLGPAVLERGDAFLRKYQLIRKVRTQRGDGTILLQAKAVDSFNFVNHVWLLLDVSERHVLRCGCDCVAAGQRAPVCEHCGALARELPDLETGTPPATPAPKRPEPLPPLPWEQPEAAPPPPVPPEDGAREVPPPSIPPEDGAREVPPPPVPPEDGAREVPPPPVPPEDGAREVLPPPVPPEDGAREVPPPPVLPEDGAREMPPAPPVEDAFPPEPDWTDEPEDGEDAGEEPFDGEDAPDSPSAEEEDEPDGQTHRTMEILFGTNLDGGSPVFWRPNDTEQVFHTNAGIIGTMGTGKTQFTKSLVAQLCRNQRDNYDGAPFGILIFDYKGDYNETKADFVAATGARVLKPCRLPYNPLALNRPKSFKPLLPIHTANEFQTTLSKIYHLGPKQQQVLLDCILKAYAARGIDPSAPETWQRRAPTFDQVYRIFEQENAGRTVDSLTAAMSKLYRFCLFESDPNRARPLADLLRGVVVIDLSGYDSDIQSLIVAITLDQFYAQMHAHGSSATDGRYRQLRNLILVDEADSFLSQRHPSLRKIMKEGREFGVGVILSTQSLSHFVGDDDDYSRYVLTWVVHNVSDIKQRDLEYVFKFQPKDPEIAASYARVKGLKKHESVVKVSNEAPVAIRDRAFWELCRDIAFANTEK